MSVGHVLFMCRNSSQSSERWQHVVTEKQHKPKQRHACCWAWLLHTTMDTTQQQGSIAMTTCWLLVMLASCAQMHPSIDLSLIARVLPCNELDTFTLCTRVSAGKGALRRHKPPNFQCMTTSIQHCTSHSYPSSQRAVSKHPQNGASKTFMLHNSTHGLQLALPTSHVDHSCCAKGQTVLKDHSSSPTLCCLIAHIGHSFCAASS